MKPIINRILAFYLYRTQTPLPGWLDPKSVEKINYIATTIYPMAAQYITNGRRLAREKRKQLKFEDKVDFKTAVAYLLSAVWLTEEEKQDVRNAQHQLALLVSISKNLTTTNPIKSVLDGKDSDDDDDDDTRQRVSNPIPRLQIVSKESRQLEMDQYIDQLHMFIAACIENEMDPHFDVNFSYYTNHNSNIDVYLQALEEFITSVVQKLKRLKPLLNELTNENIEQIIQKIQSGSLPEDIRPSDEVTPEEMEEFNQFFSFTLKTCYQFYKDANTLISKTQDLLHTYVAIYLIPEPLTLVKPTALNKISYDIQRFETALRCIQKLKLSLSQQPIRNRLPQSAPVLTEAEQSTGTNPELPAESAVPAEQSTELPAEADVTQQSTEFPAEAAVTQQSTKLPAEKAEQPKADAPDMWKNFMGSPQINSAQPFVNPTRRIPRMTQSKLPRGGKKHKRTKRMLKKRRTKKCRKRFTKRF